MSVLQNTKPKVGSLVEYKDAIGLVVKITLGAHFTYCHVEWVGETTYANVQRCEDLKVF